VQSNGTAYRVFSLQTRSRIIQVAQDLSVRQTMARRLALRAAAPIAAMAPLLMLSVVWLVDASLAPLNRIRRQVSQRRADDLSAVGDQGLPEEIRPLVRELNLLFGRLERAFQVQKNFVADAAHELRSPLAALKLQTEGLKRAPDDAAKDVAVHRLAAGIERAARLVEQLLVLTRQEDTAAGGAEPVSLSELARQAVTEWAAIAHAHGIDLGLTHCDDGTIFGRPEALTIAVRNLLDNAIKYTPSPGTVDLEVRRAGSFMILAVDDSGPGIPDHQRMRAMDRFTRLAGSEVPGSGLGLAIVKTIADCHGARLILDHSAKLGGLRASLQFSLPKQNALDGRLDRHVPSLTET
jgi:two-component system OmpR family sensor kinase